MKANKERLIADVKFLTSIYPYRNYLNVESLNEAAEYIKRVFEDIGFVTGTQTWPVNGSVYRNVIASYQPEKQRRLVLGAHYDVFRNQPGADDNASGVAGLLETARLIMQQAPKIDYRIDFVAYSLEEPPFFGKKEMGSYVHAKSLHDQKADLIGMICFEMIGYYSGKTVSESKFRQGVKLELPDSDKFIGVISIRRYADFHRHIFDLMKYENKYRTGFVSFPNDSPGPSLSDNRNYWHFGYPAVMLNHGPSSGKSPHYHQPSDTIETLDFDVMSEVVSAVAGAVIRL